VKCDEREEKKFLQDRALLLLYRLWGFKGSENGFVEDILEPFLCQSRAFDVLHSSKFPCKLLSILYGDGLLFDLGKLFKSGSVVSQINLCANEKERRLGTMMRDFRNPL